MLACRLTRSSLETSSLQQASHRWCMLASGRTPALGRAPASGRALHCSWGHAAPCTTHGPCSCMDRPACPAGLRQHDGTHGMCPPHIMIRYVPHPPHKLCARTCAPPPPTLCTRTCTIPTCVRARVTPPTLALFACAPQLSPPVRARVCPHPPPTHAPRTQTYMPAPRTQLLPSCMQQRRRERRAKGASCPLQGSTHVRLLWHPRRPRRPPAMAPS
jgi:hypothetical protein